MSYDHAATKKELMDILEKEDALIHVVFNYTLQQIKEQSFSIRTDGHPDLRDRRGRFIIELARILDLRPVEFEKQPDGTWKWKEEF